MSIGPRYNSEDHMGCEIKIHELCGEVAILVRFLEHAITSRCGSVEECRVCRETRGVLAIYRRRAVLGEKLAGALSDESLSRLVQESGPGGRDAIEVLAKAILDGGA